MSGFGEGDRCDQADDQRDIPQLSKQGTLVFSTKSF